MSHITDKYDEINAVRIPKIGSTKGDEKPSPDGGLFQEYVTGESIYWHSLTGAHLIYGLIKTKYLSLGGPGGGLGYPTNDESDAGSGKGSRYNSFQNGTIIWKNGTNEAYPVWGAILSKWAENNWDSGYLGFPLSGEIETQGTNGHGRHQFFENGTIFWTPDRGTFIKHTIVNIQKPQPGLEKQIGFVLSGGGSRGDFQLGAIAALIESGISPDMIYSTSVGSLNGLMIAHGSSGLDILRNIWFGLRRNDHMYLFDDWWNLMDPDIRNLLQSLIRQDPTTDKALVDLLEKKVGISVLEGGTIGSILSPPFTIVSILLNFIKLGFDTGAKLMDVLNLIQNNARSVFNLNPVYSLFNIFTSQALVDDWAKSGKGKKLRMATVGLNSGELCYVTETGDLIDRSQQKVLSKGITLVEGAMASAAIGGVFVPPIFANDAWVDGGHRENIPLQGAIDGGARKVYVISTGPVNRNSAVNATEEGIKIEDYKTEKKIIDIALRAIVEISGDEIASNDIFSLIDGYGADIKLIAPQFPTHFIISIDAELIRINYDYGYRVALDVLNNVPGNLREMSDQIAIKQAKAAILRQKSLKALGVPFSSEINSLLTEIAGLITARQQNNLSIAGTPASQSIGLGDTLLPGEMLVPGQCIVSADPSHQYTLRYNTNGNLELYLRSGANLFGQPPVWKAPIPVPEPGGICIMQMDGNLVVYNNQMNALWASASNSTDHYNGFLRVQSDGVVTLNKKDGGVYWSSNGIIDPASTINYVTIKNNTSLVVTTRFYNVGDHVLGILTTIGDGLRTVPANGMVSWQLPPGVSSVQITFNGNPGSAKVIAAGQTIEWNTDERIHLVNKTSADVRVRIFDGSQIFGPGGIALPNGELNIGSNKEVYWSMPDHILKVGILFNDLNPQILFRGSKYEYNLPEQRVFIQNLSNAKVKVQFFNEKDGLAATSIFSRPGEDRDINANGLMYYTLPAGASKIQIRFVQPGKPNVLVMSNLGSKYSYNADGSVTIPVFP